MEENKENTINDTTVNVPIEWLRRDKLAYTIHELIDKEDLSRFEVMYADFTEDALVPPPSVLLKAILLGYINGIESSYLLEDLCKTNAIFIAITANIRPDYSFFSNCVKTVSEQMKSLFVKVLSICNEMGINLMFNTSFINKKKNKSFEEVISEMINNHIKNDKGKRISLEEYNQIGKDEFDKQIEKTITLLKNT
jgi:transposase